MIRYPNLELLEYKAREILLKDTEFIEKFKERRKRCQMDIKVDVFPQTWATTALGFDMEDGFAGQAFTEAYTSVFHEVFTDTYVVFFGDRAAYKVTDANDNFKNDLAERNLASVRIAHDKY